MGADEDRAKAYWDLPWRAVFSFLNLVMRARLVSQRTSTRANRATDQRALPASQQSANHRSPRRGTNYDLRAGMVPMVARFLSLSCSPVSAMSSSLLGTCRNWKTKHRNKGKQGDRAANNHGILHVPLFRCQAGMTECL